MSHELPTDEFYYVYGINGSTGAYLDDPFSPQEVGEAARVQAEKPNDDEIRILKTRSDMQQPSFGVAMDVDVKNLGQTGWGIIFAKDADTEIKKTLKELLDKREEDTGDLFKIYEGDDGYLPGDTWESFRKRHKVKSGLAKPEQMPFYLLIVGDPETIPYDFQYMADVERAVGRIYFDNIEDYAYYAQSIVLAEDKNQPLQLPRKATFFGTSNPDDKATKYSSKDLIAGLAEELTPALQKHSWGLDIIEPVNATKDRLGNLLGGSQTPSLLFTATHGAGFNQDDKYYPKHQGALVTQDWPGPREWKKRLLEEHFFSGEDVVDSAQLWGMIAVFFACFGAGTPRKSDFFHIKEYQPKEQLRLANEALLASLPRKLLSHHNGGALAVVGHVERAWTTSFKEGPGPFAPQDFDVFKELFRLLMLGFPIGVALEEMNTRLAQLSTELTRSLYPVLHQGMNYTDELKLEVARLWTKNNDARNYIIIGDPAVRLPVSEKEIPYIEHPILKPFEIKLATEEKTSRKIVGTTPQLEESEMNQDDIETHGETFWAPGGPPDYMRSDPELLQFWREHIKAGYEYNDEMFRRILKAFLGPYYTTVWMNGIIFAVGILSFISAVALSIYFGEALFALAFGGLSIAAFLSYFISRPLRSLEENLEFITWLGIIYNTYWTRLVASNDPNTTQHELQAAAKDAITELERMIDKHSEMSGKRPKPVN